MAQKQPKQRRRAATPSPRAPASADGALNIDEFLRGLGYDTPSANRGARAVLEAAGLTNPRKQAIAAYKRAEAEVVLGRAFVRVCCDECTHLARERRTRRMALMTSAGRCEICEGSNNRRAAVACRAVLRKHGVRNVLIVGGTVHQHHEVAALLASDGLTVEFVDGTQSSHSQKDAVQRMNRAQLAVIWGATPLRHAVSNLYTDDPPQHLRVISFAKRGIEALCREVIRSYEPRTRP